MAAIKCCWNGEFEMRGLTRRLDALEERSADLHPMFNLRLATDQELRLLMQLAEMADPIDWDRVPAETFEALEKVTIKYQVLERPPT
jgi:hypothetical protein